MKYKKSELSWELENLCPCGSGDLFKDCCNEEVSRERTFNKYAMT